MIDPRTLRGAGLSAFDPEVLVDDFDDDEPLVLEGVSLTATDLAHLAGVPIALDGCFCIWL